MTMTTADLDCGDNSCMFASHRGGVRTNGGCRCLDGLEPKHQMAIHRRIARIAELERENLQLREQYADAVQADKTASALPLKNQSTLITRLTERLADARRMRETMSAEWTAKRDAHERTKAELSQLQRNYLAIADEVAAECESTEQLVNIARATRAERDAALADAAALRAVLSDRDQVSQTSAVAERKAKALAGTAGRDLAERVKRLEAVERWVRTHLADRGDAVATILAIDYRDDKGGE